MQHNAANPTAPALRPAVLPDHLLSRVSRYFAQIGPGAVLVALVAVLLIAAIWILAYERIAHEQRSASEAALRHTSTMTHVMAQHTMRTLQQAEQTMIRVAHEYIEHKRNLDIERLSREGIIDVRMLESVGVLDAQGMVVASTGPSARNSLADRDYYIELRGGRRFHVGKPVWGVMSRKWVVPIALAIREENGAFAGVVFSGIAPTYFIDFYREQELGERGSVTLTGFDGYARVRRSGHEDSFQHDFREWRLLEDARRAPSGAFTGTSPIDRVQRFYSYHVLPEYDLIASVGVSVEEVMAPYLERQQVYRQGTTLATVFVLLAAVVLLIAMRHRRLARQELALKNVLLTTQQEASPDGIVLVQADGRTASCNERFRALWQLTDDCGPATGLQFPDAIVSRIRDGEAFAAQVARMTQHPSEVFHGEILTVDGRHIDCHCSAAVEIAGELHGHVWYFRDITERKLNEAQARMQELQRQAILDNIPSAAWLKDTDLRYVAVNRSFLETMELPLEAIIGHTDLDLFPAEAAAQHRASDIEVMRTGKVKREDELLLGERRLYIETMKTRVCDSQGKVVGVVGLARDISDDRRIEEQLRLSAKAFENIGDGVLITDANSIILSVNRAFSDISGYRPEEVLGKTPAVLRSGRHDAAFYQAMWRQLHDEGHWRGEVWNRRKNGEVYPELLAISAVKDGAGVVTHYVAVFTDISSLKHYEQQLRYQAHHDALTGLPNRVLFHDRFTEALQRATRHDGRCAVLMLDVDRFKEINDSLGHAAGDELLKIVAQRLRTVLREADTVARFGGDEFMVLLDGIADNRAPATVAQKLIDILAQPMQVAGHELYISGSIGISCYPDDGANAETLLKHADVAMYRAKAKGRNTYRFYSTEMNARALEYLVMTNGLRQALERDEFRLHYQPRIDLRTGRIAGVEALIRWQHPEEGLLSPGRFIAIAEETGLIVPIGAWVLREAARQMRVWRDQGLQLDRMAVNLSARQFRDPALVATVEAALEEAGLDAPLLELEVTESMLVDEPQQAADLLTHLKGHGIALAVDDFGTGYSSLGYLKRFPLDYLKIDQSFVRGVPDGQDDCAITLAIINLAKSLGLQLVAEGVETDAQRAFLRAAGCEYGQGYLFSRPVHAAQIEAMMRGATSVTENT